MQYSCCVLLSSYERVLSSQLYLAWPTDRRVASVNANIPFRPTSSIMAALSLFRASTRCHACRCNIACKWTVMHKYAGTYLVSMMKCVTGAFLQSCEWAQDKLTERDVKLMISGRSGGSGTSETGKAERDN